MGASPMPMPYALCPMPARAPHVTEKGYILTSHTQSGKPPILDTPRSKDVGILASQGFPYQFQA
jgi:hypothetical protein